MWLGPCGSGKFLLHESISKDFFVFLKQNKFLCRPFSFLASQRPHIRMPRLWPLKREDGLTPLPKTSMGFRLSYHCRQNEGAGDGIQLQTISPGLWNPSLDLATPVTEAGFFLLCKPERAWERCCTERLIPPTTSPWNHFIITLFWSFLSCYSPIRPWFPDFVCLGTAPALPCSYGRVKVVQLQGTWEI